VQRKQKIDLLGGSVLVVFSGLMGFNQVLVKLVNAGLQPAFQVGLRSACAILPIIAFALITRKKLTIHDGSFWPGILAGLFFTTEFVLLFQSLEYTSVSRASIMFYSMPFWVALGAHFLIPEERLTKLRIVGLLLAIGGVTLALSDNSKPVSDLAWLGDLMSLAGGVFWAGILLLTRKTKLSNATPEMNLIYQLSVSALVLLTVSPLFGSIIREITPAIIGIFSFQVLIVVCIGFVAWFWVLSVYPASDMASFGFLAPLFGVFFGWLILDEQITLRFAGALAFVCIGIIMVNRKPTQS
jgi:drug/metabolite transporter (DMT)-like permease